MQFERQSIISNTSICKALYTKTPASSRRQDLKSLTYLTDDISNDNKMPIKLISQKPCEKLKNKVKKYITDNKLHLIMCTMSAHSSKDSKMFINNTQAVKRQKINRKNGAAQQRYSNKQQSRTKFYEKYKASDNNPDGKKYPSRKMQTILFDKQLSETNTLLRHKSLKSIDSDRYSSIQLQKTYLRCKFSNHSLGYMNLIKNRRRGNYRSIQNIPIYSRLKRNLKRSFTSCLLRPIRPKVNIVENNTHTTKTTSLRKSSKHENAFLYEVNFVSSKKILCSKEKKRSNGYNIHFQGNCNSRVSKKSLINRRTKIKKLPKYLYKRHYQMKKMWNNLTIHKIKTTLPKYANIYREVSNKTQYGTLQRNICNGNLVSYFSKNYNIKSNSFITQNLYHIISKIESESKRSKHNRISCITMNLLDTESLQHNISDPMFSTESMLLNTYNTSMFKKLVNCVKRFKNQVENKSIKNKTANQRINSSSAIVKQENNKDKDDFFHRDFDDDVDDKQIHHNRGFDDHITRRPEPFDNRHKMKTRSKPKIIELKKNKRYPGKDAKNDEDVFPNERDMYNNNHKLRDKRKLKELIFADNDSDDQSTNKTEQNNELTLNPRNYRYNKNKLGHDRDYKDSKDDIADTNNMYGDNMKLKYKTKLNPKHEKYNRNKISLANDFDDNLSNRTYMYNNNTANKSRKKRILDIERDIRNETERELVNNESGDHFAIRTDRHKNKRKLDPRHVLSKYNRNKTDHSLSIDEASDFPNETNIHNDKTTSKRTTKLVPIVQRSYKDKSSRDTANDNHNSHFTDKTELYDDNTKQKYKIKLNQKLGMYNKNKTKHNPAKNYEFESDNSDSKFPSSNAVSRKRTNLIPNHERDNRNKFNSASPNNNYNDDFTNKDDTDDESMKQKYKTKLKAELEYYNKNKHGLPKKVHKERKNKARTAERYVRNNTDPDFVSDISDIELGSRSDLYSNNNKLKEQPKLRYLGSADENSDDKYANESDTYDYKTKQYGNESKLSPNNKGLNYSRIGSGNSNDNVDDDVAQKINKHRDNMERKSLYHDKNNINKADRGYASDDSNEDLPNIINIIKDTSPKTRTKINPELQSYNKNKTNRGLIKINPDDDEQNNQTKRKPTPEKHIRNRANRGYVSEISDIDFGSNSDSYSDKNKRINKTKRHQQLNKNKIDQRFTNENVDKNFTNRDHDNNKHKPKTLLGTKSKRNKSDCECGQGVGDSQIIHKKIENRRDYSIPNRTDKNDSNKNKYKSKRNVCECFKDHKGEDRGDRFNNNNTDTLNPKHKRYETDSNLTDDHFDEDFMGYRKSKKKRIHGNQNLKEENMNPTCIKLCNDDNLLKKKVEWYKKLKKELESEFADRRRRNIPSGIQLKQEGKLSSKRLSLKMSEQDVLDLIKRTLDSEDKLKLENYYVANRINKFDVHDNHDIGKKYWKRYCEYYLTKDTHRLFTLRKYKTTHNKNKSNAQLQARRLERNRVLLDISDKCYSVIENEYIGKFYTRTLHKRPCYIILHRIWVRLYPRVMYYIQHTKRITRLYLFRLVFPCWSPKLKK